MTTDAPHDPTPPADPDRAALREKLAECRSTLEAQMGVARKLDAMIFDLGNKLADEAAAHAQTAAAVRRFLVAVDTVVEMLDTRDRNDPAFGPAYTERGAALDALRAALALRPPGLVDGGETGAEDG
jgi:hypothetical protein